MVDNVSLNVDKDSFKVDKDAEEFGVDYSELDGFTIRHLPIPSTLWGPQSEPSLFKRGMYAKCGKLQRAAKLLAEGYSVRQILRLTGVSKNTTRKLRIVLKNVAGIEAKCACGELATHQGWCAVRFAKSERRQQFMRRWHKARRSVATPTMARSPKVRSKVIPKGYSTAQSTVQHADIPLVACLLSTPRLARL